MSYQASVNMNAPSVQMTSGAGYNNNMNMNAGYNNNMNMQMQTPQMNMGMGGGGVMVVKTSTTYWTLWSNRCINFKHFLARIRNCNLWMYSSLRKYELYWRLLLFLLVRSCSLFIMGNSSRMDIRNSFRVPINHGCCNGYEYVCFDGTSNGSNRRSRRRHCSCPLEYNTSDNSNNNCYFFIFLRIKLKYFQQ